MINEKTQVQSMPHTKGHLYRFRVLDGVSATPTEISATDEFTMREWMAYIRLVSCVHTYYYSIFKYFAIQSVVSLVHFVEGVTGLCKLL